MKYLLIAFIIFVALAPLSHFVPSKRQRRVARLRESAALRGLYVEYRALPDSELKPGVDMVYYGKRVRARGRSAFQRRIWRYDAAGWRGPRRELVPAELAGLPAGSIALGEEQDHLGVYWDESGDEAEIEQIATVLTALAEIHYR